MHSLPGNTIPNQPADPEATLPPVDLHNIARGGGSIALGHELGEQESVFETAKNHEHMVSDELAVRVMDKKFEARRADGSHSTQNANFLKIYLDQVEAGQADHDFATNPDSISSVHNQIADLISEKLRVYVKSVDPNDARMVAARSATMADLRTRKTAYLQKLEADKNTVRTFAHDVIAKPNAILTPQPSALEFQGFRTKVYKADGTTSEVNLLRKPLPDIRPNMTIQEEGGQTFVHWSSSEYMQKRIEGDKTEFKKRIYLNPKSEASVAIFKDIIEAADADGLAVRGKLFDRASDGLSKSRTALAGQDFMNRADGILLYAGDDEADKLMAIVNQVYAKYQPDFEGRGMSAIPFQLKDGLAVGDEPANSNGKVSLTSSRIAALSEASDETHQQLGVHDAAPIPRAQRALAVNLFKKNFAKVAAKAGIDVHNIAFNAAPGAQKLAAPAKPNTAPAAAAPQPRKPEQVGSSETQGLSPQELQARAESFFTKGVNGNFLDDRQADDQQKLRLRKMLVLISKDGDKAALEDYASIRKTILAIKESFPEGTDNKKVRAAIIDRSIMAVRRTEAMLVNATDPEVKDEVARRMLRATLVLDAYGGVAPVGAKTAYDYLSDRMRRR